MKKPFEMNLQLFAEPETMTTPRGSLPNNMSGVTAREIDFVQRFGRNWDALRQIMGITRPIRKTPGTKLVSYKASVTLEDGNVPEGAIIPYSKGKVLPVAYGDVIVEKYAKAVTIEEVNRYGATVAIEKTDDAFLIELQNKVLTKFYTFLRAGTLVSAETTFQMALAMARGNVINKFRAMRRDVTDVVGFCNVLDAYRYLGETKIDEQSQHGMTYLTNFMGYGTLFLLSDEDIPRGTVIATPVENIDLYYVDPADSDFAKLGLTYTVKGDTNLIGFHANGNYTTAVGESFAVMGMTLWAEYMDGIAVVTIDDTTLHDLTVASETDAFGVLYGGKKASDLQTDVTVTGDKITGSLKYIEGGLADSGPLAGSGHFLALKWSNLASGTNSLKVGLVPSASGMPLQECFDDNDRNGVFKITDVNQVFEIVQADAAGHKNIQFYDLTGLTLEPAEA